MIAKLSWNNNQTNVKHSNHNFIFYDNAIKQA